jgi:hypothetical protein
VTILESDDRLVTRTLDRLRHELRVLGPWLFALPLLAAAGLCVLAGVLHARHVNPDFGALVPVAIVEACLPLAAAILCATVAVHDDALEVQLSLPRVYARTALLRGALLCGWIAALEIGATLALGSIFPSLVSGSLARTLLVWLAPMLWLAGAGWLLAVVLRSRAVAIALVGTLWIAQLAFHGYFASQGWARPWFLFATVYVPGAVYWWTNRAELLTTGGVMCYVAWVIVANPERRLRVEEE